MPIRIWCKSLPAQEIADWQAIFEVEDEAAAAGQPEASEPASDDTEDREN